MRLFVCQTKIMRWGKARFPAHARAGLIFALVFVLLAGPYIALGQSSGPNPLERLGMFVGFPIFLLIGLFLGVSGALFDGVIDIFVLGMGAQVHGTFGDAITAGWELVRDIANIAFVFGFVYIGIMTILDPEKANTKRLLAQLIIAALLINFSLFFTRVVIDVANIATVEIRDLMVIRDAGGNEVDIGIGGAFMQHLGVADLYNPEGISFSSIGDTWGAIFSEGSFAFFILASFLMLTAAFVFAAGAVLLLIRFAALLLIMIFSPVLFAATVFPQTEKYAKQLWDLLFRYAFFAPLLLLLLLMSFLLISQGTADGSLLDALHDSGHVDVLARFVLIIIFLIMSVVAANKLGIAGSDAVVSTATKAGGFAVGGTLGMAGRATLGRLGDRLIKSSFVQDRLHKKGLAGFVGRRAADVGKAARGASYDWRQIGGVGKKFGMGEGKRGGYEQSMREAQQKEQEYAKLLIEDKEAAAAVRAQYGEFDSQFADSINALKRKKQTDTRPLLDQLRVQASLANDTTQDAGTRAAAQMEVARINANLQQINDDFQQQLEMLERGRKETKERGEQEATAKETEKMRSYAESLEQRVSGWPFTYTPGEYRAMAQAMRKEMGKGDNDKLIDAIKNINTSS